MPATMSNSDCPYADPADLLQQGDIFCAPLVAPITDSTQRLFRSVDGQHGSVVLSGERSGKIFSRSELAATLLATRRDALHTDPFQKSPDGQMEFVIANADLIEYFITISQTCDICGEDHAPKPLAMILKAKSIRHLCRTEPLPFKGEPQGRTIHEYILSKNDSPALREANEAAYRNDLKETITSWNPASANDRENLGKIKNFLSALKRGGSTYYLPGDEDRFMPPLYIDFLTAFTVTTTQLGAMKPKRTATLSDVRRAHFAKAFADHISRVALPASLEKEFP